MPLHAERSRRVLKEIKQLIEHEFPRGSAEDIYSQMLTNVIQFRQNRPDLYELKLLNTAFKELRYALRVFKPYRSYPKAAVFGSARTPAGHPDYKMAARFGKKLAKEGWMIITGGASGIMEAALVGAGVKRSFGLNILLPFEQGANFVIEGNHKLMHFKYFFTRKLMFLKESKATVLFPGGFGTLDEGFESLTLVQTGKDQPRPLVFVDTPGSTFWTSAMRFFKKQLEGQRFISPGDLRLIRHAQSPDSAVREVTGFYKNYHSSRFIGDNYLIRLRKTLSLKQLETINRRFKGLLAQGRFERFQDLKHEDNKNRELDRLAFRFNRADYQRLRLLIDYLNTL